MSRRINGKAVVTLTFLLGLLVMILLRANGWRLPSTSEWGAFGSNRRSANPEDAIYSMLDAARAGDIKAYLNSFSGSMRDQLQQVIKENDESKFASYLTGQYAALQSVAVTVTDRSSENEAEVRVEYVYSNRNEVQSVYLKKEGDRWKVLKVGGSEQIETLIPFGTTVTE
jgi:hypothetical protein